MTETLLDERAQVAQLVLRAQRGDRDAFGQLFERFEQHVFAIALRRLRHHTEAQELCQDVFVQAMLKLDQLREPECFGGWLRAITHRMAINQMVRRGHDQPTSPESLDANCVESATPLGDLLESEQKEQVRAGLGRLGDLDRETLEAFYVHGHSLIEMSDSFAAPLGTIKRRLHVARKRLAKEVEPLCAV